MLSILRKWFRRARPAALGPRGEQHAAGYVRRELKYKILATNVRAAGAELDIVALDGEDLVFIEVRTRSTDAFGAPEKSIRRNKRRFVVRAARDFIRRRRLGRFNPRFDTIAIVWPAGGGGAAEPVVRYQRNAFHADGR